MLQFKNDKLLSAVKKADSFLLCTHVSPDGDAIGSTLAMAFFLEDMGKKVTVACSDPVPYRMHFLPCWEMFVRPEELEGKKFDCAIAIDCAEESRMGACRFAYNKAPVRLQIDHHGTNPLYAMENEVDGTAAAAGCIIWRFAKALDLEITKDHAACLYTAISSDTGNFCFENTGSECFECIADLIDHGLSINEVARPLHLIREVPHVRLLAKALDSLKLCGDGKIAGMKLQKKDYLDCDAAHEHSDKIVNYAMDLEGVVLAYMADDTMRGGTKFSLRAQPPYNVAKIAQKFGGGGHVLAAGCTMDAPMDEAIELIENAMLEQLKNG